MRHKSELKTKRIKVSKLAFIWIPVIVFGILTVFLGIEGAGYGARLAQLTKKAKDLEIQNKELSQQLINSTSLQDLNAKSEELGYIKPVNIVYLGESSVAQAP